MVDGGFERGVAVTLALAPSQPVSRAAGKVMQGE